MPETIRQDTRLSATGFEILPAIDLLSGACVRLRQGRYDAVTRYRDDPVEIARGFEAAGARWIHLVDLDAAHRMPGASEGSNNRAVIRRIRRAVSCRLEVGGGIRSQADAQELLDAGIDRLVLGTVLVRAPEQVAAWCSSYGRVFMAGIDAAAGKVKVDGWEQDGAADDLEVARRLRKLGMAGVIYTSILRDGTMAGPDLARSNRVAAIAALPVVVSGGIAGAADVERVLRERHPGVCGVIVGKALYEGRVDLAELIRRFRISSALE